MPRYLLTEAREAKELSKVELAELLRCEYKAVIKWEQGTQEPNSRMKKVIRRVLANTHPDLFKNFPASETQALQPCADMSVSGRLDSSDVSVQEEESTGTDMDPRRRKVNTAIAIAASTIPTIPLATTTQFVLNPLVDAYLNTCETSLNTWWHWYNSDNDIELERALGKNLPMLKAIALPLPFQTTISPYQKQAASIATEMLIMQIGMDNSSMQYSQREKHCFDAVQMGDLSGDKNLLALAQYWYGDTFTYCYEDPQTAIRLLNDALKSATTVDGNPLIATRIYSDMAIAHAQNHDESNALDFIALAYSTMPSNPVFDDCLYDVGHAELDQMIGKTYLYLAEKLHNRSYAEKAHKLFKKSISATASNGYLVQVLIRTADTTRLLDQKEECITHLTQAYKKASSVSRLTQISNVLSRMPDNWKRETAITELQGEVSNKLVLARG